MKKIQVGRFFDGRAGTLIIFLLGLTDTLINESIKKYGIIIYLFLVQSAGNIFVRLSSPQPSTVYITNSLVRLNMSRN